MHVCVCLICAVEGMTILTGRDVGVYMYGEVAVVINQRVNYFLRSADRTCPDKCTHVYGNALRRDGVEGTNRGTWESTSNQRRGGGLSLSMCLSRKITGVNKSFVFCTHNII